MYKLVYKFRVNFTIVGAEQGYLSYFNVFLFSDEKAVPLTTQLIVFRGLHNLTYWITHYTLHTMEYLPCHVLAGVLLTYISLTSANWQSEWMPNHLERTPG